MAIENGKLQLELRAYQDFQKKFKEGKFKGQRFGQAFYDHFKMHRVVRDKDALDLIYTQDGDAAKASIKELFKFN